MSGIANDQGGIALDRLGFPPRAPIGLGPGISLADNTPPLPGYVRLSTGDYGGGYASIDLALTGEAHMLSDSYTGGWSSIERKGNVDATVWTSGKPLKQALPVILDRLHAEGDVAAEFNLLERICRPQNGARPPIVTINGPALHTDRRWIITDLGVGEDSFVRDAGKLKRVGPFVITLTQHVTIDVKSASKKKAAARTTTVKVKAKQGEDVYAFAKRVFGSKTAKLVHEIVKLNGLHDPHAKLKAGQKLKVPERYAFKGHAISGGAGIALGASIGNPL